MAVGALIDPGKELVGGELRLGPSLYDQLVAELAATATRGETRGTHKSMPPVWVEAMDLRVEIDDAVRAWQPDGASTPDRLRGLAARRWRPQDTRSVEQIAANLESWAAPIKALLSPQHVKHVSSPCPACNATHVYRRDAAGEMVRMPALQIVADTGCTCQGCGAHWAPDRYLWLCKVLGFELPAGVLE